MEKNPKTIAGIIGLAVMLVLLIRNQFDMQGVLRDIRRIAKAVRGILRDLSRTIRAFAKDAKRKKPREVRKAADLKPNGAPLRAFIERRHQRNRL